MAQEGEDGQQWLGFIEADRAAGKRITGYEYAVLVTNAAHEVLSLGQLYRDRADAENAFDELKNQWGWGGFTTHDLHRCRLSARLQVRTKGAAEQFRTQAVWRRVCGYLKQTLAAIGSPPSCLKIDCDTA